VLRQSHPAYVCGMMESWKIETAWDILRWYCSSLALNGTLAKYHLFVKSL